MTDPAFLIIFLITAPNGSSHTIFKNIFIIRTLQSCLPAWLLCDVLDEREDGSNVSWKPIKKSSLPFKYLLRLIIFDTCVHLKLGHYREINALKY